MFRLGGNLSTGAVFSWTKARHQSVCPPEQPFRGQESSVSQFVHRIAIIVANFFVLSLVLRKDSLKVVSFLGNKSGLLFGEVRGHFLRIEKRVMRQ